MRCPFCQQDNDKVINTRSCDDAYTIRRRRECNDCGQRYTTFERLEECEVKVVKKDGVREPFVREKILAGLKKACWKRPVPDDAIEGLVVKVEAKVFGERDRDREISSRELGVLVMQMLADIDQVAFVRFASVYREFKDVNDFVDELTPMLRQQWVESNAR